MNLNDLSDEMLSAIFDHLDLVELKKACFVCRRWSELTFSGRRMDRAVLVNCNREFLFNTKRNYRNVRQRWVEDDDFESLVRLLHTIKPHVRMLDIQCAVTNEELRLILLEAPELQHLSMNLLDPYCNTNGPLPVLPKLKSLVLYGSIVTQFDVFPSKLNTPNLQCLNMSCSTYLEMEAWKYFSGQLKLAHVSALDKRYLHPFLELTFPSLEDLAINKYQNSMIEEKAFGGSNDFFRRHPFLQRISTSMIQWVESITRHCPELTYLHLFLNYPKEELLESVVLQMGVLRELKHLSLEGKVDRKIIRGVMTSLESVQLKMHRSRVLLENLFEVVPRLSSLEIAKGTLCDELQFICEKFSCLRRLELKLVCFKLPPVADDFVRFDRLVHLQDLKLSGLFEIRIIHPNNVRCLTLYGYPTIPITLMTNDDLYQIPAKFPLLKRLILESWASSDCVNERLHELMPSCRIDHNNKRYYPIDDATAE